MSTEPLVSVVMPVFNALTSISETLDSALAQTYRNIEIIVVNDGSTDETMAVVSARARADKRIRVVEQENAGVAAARNRGIAAAEGEFIAPFDSDDIWDSTKLERQVRRMQEYGTRAGFVYSWWVWIDERGRILDSSPRWRLEGQVFEKLIQVNFTGNASVPLFRRKAIELVGGYDLQFQREGAQGCEDWDLALRVAEKTDAAAVSAVLVGYRRRRGSMSADCQSMWRSQALVAKGIRQRQPLLRDAVFQQSADQIALHLAGVSFWSGSYPQALFWALRGWRSSLKPEVFRYLVVVLARTAFRRRAKTKTLIGGQCFDNSHIPDPLMPYDRIWEHRWLRQVPGQSPLDRLSGKPTPASMPASNRLPAEPAPFESDGP